MVEMWIITFLSYLWQSHRYHIKNKYFIIKWDTYILKFTYVNKFIPALWKMSIKRKETNEIPINKGMTE